MQDTEGIRKVRVDLPELEGSFYGLVIHIIFFPTAMNQTGGNKFFHHLVDTDIMASSGRSSESS